MTPDRDRLTGFERIPISQAAISMQTFVTIVTVALALVSASLTVWIAIIYAK